MQRKTPQEKKAESYAKDRRNTYGENDKSSRKNIPRSQRIRNRAERRIAREAFATPVVYEERLDAAETRARLRRLNGFFKQADTPLGEVLKSKLARRAAAEARTAERPRRSTTAE